jgi:excinuclease ABC subunit A
MDSFQALLDKGHSILAIEHNTDVMKSADWIIDLGPEGGDKGGNLVYSGTLEGLKKVKNSNTAKFL